jgi:hypothetical protein
MHSKFQARRISKQRIEFLRKSGRMKDAMVLDSFTGYLIVEPVGSDLGDGDVLEATETDFELNTAWCLTTRSRLNEARKRLGLEREAPSEAIALEV